jgi:hypothetical protein
MRRSYALPKWRFYDLLINLGTTAQIIQMLEDRGYTPPPRTSIQGWRNRNLLPAPWVPVFIQLAFDKGLIRKIEDLKVIDVSR